MCLHVQELVLHARRSKQINIPCTWRLSSALLSSYPAKTNLQDHARILQESCMQDLSPFSCTILHQLLARSCKKCARNDSCSNSCKILHHFLQDMCKLVQESCKKRDISRASLACKILAQSCMILQVRFCWVGMRCPVSAYCSSSLLHGLKLMIS